MGRWASQRNDMLRKPLSLSCFTDKSDRWEGCPEEILCLRQFKCFSEQRTGCVCVWQRSVSVSSSQSSHQSITGTTAAGLNRLQVQDILYYCELHMGTECVVSKGGSVVQTLPPYRVCTCHCGTQDNVFLFKWRCIARTNYIIWDKGFDLYPGICSTFLFVVRWNGTE